MAVAPDWPTMPRLSESGLQVGRQLAQAPSLEHRMLAPAELALHRVADLEVGMAALDDHAGAAPDHHVADFRGLAY